MPHKRQELPEHTSKQPTGAVATCATLLRAIRAARGISQEGWAARLGFGRRSVARWEAGETVPDAAAEAALLAECEALGLFGRLASGPLAGLTLTADLLRDTLAAARLAPATAQPTAPVPLRLLDQTAAPHRSLPLPLTRLIGREAERATVIALLKEARLLTLTGPGGVGKTRLALEVARRLQGSFSDGVWFVDLFGVSDPTGVIPAIAQALQVTETEGRSLAESLAVYLRSKRLLLLLDNVEQVVAAAPQLYELLTAAPRLTIVATSRVLLRVGGEHADNVPPLPLPDLADAAAPERLRHNPAVQLFVERAQALRPDFTLTADNAAAIAAICTRLDGLPLSIELAAARVRLLPPRALLERLDQRLRLLTGGDREHPRRQQTLRDTLQWSWDLLEPAEQALLRRLGVFASGWTLAAAEAVCDLAGELNVLEGLTSLVDQSLVRPREADGEARFGMLATLREFGLEQLEASGEAETLRRRHAEYYTGVVERAAAAYRRTGRTLDLLRSLDPERDEFFAALGWVEEQQDAALGLRLAGALGVWFLMRALGEGQRWLERMLGLPGGDGLTLARGVALNWATQLAIFRGESPMAAVYAEQAVAAFRAVGNVAGLSLALGSLGDALTTVDRPRAEQLVDEGLALARTTGVRLVTAYAEGYAGWPRWQAGDAAAARPHFEEAVRLARESGADYLTMHALGLLAWLERLEGRREELRRLLLEARPLAEAFSDRWRIAMFSIDLGLLASSDGDYEQATVELGTGLQAATDIGSMPFTATALAGLASVLTARGRPEAAARLLAACESAWQDAAQYGFWRSYFDTAFDIALTPTQTALSPEAFAQASMEGQALSLEQAAALALEELAAALPVRQ